MEEIRKEYLARFEEMLGELRAEVGGEIFPEASQHSEDGALILDTDEDLPRRVDAVTEDGQEYALAAGEPIPPGGDDLLSDYPFSVRVHPSVWGALPIYVRFQEPLAQGQWEDLAQLVRSWFLAGFWGAYSGYLHSLEGFTFGGRSFRCIVDMGSAEVESIHVLLNALAGFSEEMTDLEEIAFGEPPTLV